MQIYERIFTKGTKIQCKFFDTSLHSNYVGAEYTAGQDLITALTYNREYIIGLFRNLIRSYIRYLENPTEINCHSYEKDLYKIDEYCIYFHELSIVLITLIKDAHPHYSINIRRMLVRHFLLDALKEIIKDLEIMQSMNSVADIVYLPFWDKVSYYLLVWFDTYTKSINKDLWMIATSDSGYKCLDRLYVLPMDRASNYVDMKWPMVLRDGLNNPDNTKLIFSTEQNDDTSNVRKSFLILTTETLMYFDLILSLDSELPIKICKNCNVPFIPIGRPDTLYCSRVMPGFKYKCSDIGASNTYKRKQSDIEAEYFTVRKRYHIRTIRNPCLQPGFDAWKVKAKEKLSEYRNGLISADEFRKWFLNDEWIKN